MLQQCNFNEHKAVSNLATGLETADKNSFFSFYQSGNQMEY